MHSYPNPPATTSSGLPAMNLLQVADVLSSPTTQRDIPASESILIFRGQFREAALLDAREYIPSYFAAAAIHANPDVFAALAFKYSREKQMHLMETLWKEGDGMESIKEMTESVPKVAENESVNRLAASGATWKGKGRDEGDSERDPESASQMLIKVNDVFLNLVAKVEPLMVRMDEFCDKQNVGELRDVDALRSVMEGNFQQTDQIIIYKPTPIIKNYRQQQPGLQRQRPAPTKLQPLILYPRSSQPPPNQSFSLKSSELQPLNVNARQPSALDQILLAMDKGLEKDWSNNSMRALEDPDMNATMFDLFVLRNYVTKQPLKLRMSLSFADPVKIVENFWNEPPEIRFVGVSYSFMKFSQLFPHFSIPYCAIAAHFSDLSPEICFSYYERARKAVDFRRRAFWILNYSSKILRLCAGESVMPYVLLDKGVQPMHFDVSNDAFTLPLTSETTSPVYFLCFLLDIIERMGKRLVIVPNSFKELLQSPMFHASKQELDDWYSHIPEAFIITPQNLQMHMQCVERTGLMNLNMFYMAAVCVLFRPRLFLTAHLPLDSSLMTPENLGLILEALNTGVSTAFEIADLNANMLALTQFADGAVEIHQDGGVLLTCSNWKEYVHIFFSLFEAAVTLWFFYCKSRPYWWAAFCLNSEDQEAHTRAKIKQSLQEVLQSLKLLESAMSNASLNAPERPKHNMITPMVDCVEGMMIEVSETQRELKDLVLDDIVLEMEVLSIGGSTADAVPPISAQAPWVFMGLLGEK
ncbi:hypothetical protein HDU98_002795, partial [Podochytrium sp. JEL0797]